MQLQLMLKTLADDPLYRFFHVSRRVFGSNGIGTFDGSVKKARLSEHLISYHVVLLQSLINVHLNSREHDRTQTN